TAYTNFTAGSLTINLFGTVGSASVSIGQSGSITLDNTAVNQQRFTNATAPSVTLNTGSFTFLANNSPGAVSAETLGTVTLNSGPATHNGRPPAGPVAGAGGPALANPPLGRYRRGDRHLHRRNDHPLPARGAAHRRTHHPDLNRGLAGANRPAGAVLRNR